jgi:hypothetical protein
MKVRIVIFVVIVVAAVGLASLGWNWDSWDHPCWSASEAMEPNGTVLSFSGNDYWVDDDGARIRIDTDVSAGDVSWEDLHEAVDWVEEHACTVTEPNVGTAFEWQDPNATYILYLEEPSAEHILLTGSVGADFVFDVDCNDIPMGDTTIRALCLSGRVCEVMGHQWLYDYIAGPLSGRALGIYDTDPQSWMRDRTCIVCDKRESRQSTEWQ